mgnify:CR=1 FL=1
MSNNVDSRRVVTGRVRLSYVHLLKPRASQQPGSTPKYSVTLLIPKSDVATKQRIDAAIQAAIHEAIQSKWGGVRPPQPPIPIHDGDSIRANGEAFSPECKGHWVMTASSEQRPQIVDLNLIDIINPTEIYSGMYAHVSINFFGYFSNGKRGIGCGLGNVQKVADGEPLAGGMRSAADDFGGFAQAAPVYQQQPVYAPPVQPVYPQQPVYPATPVYQQPQAYPAQPAYPQQPVYGQPMQPIQPAYPQQPAQIDPITGKPLLGNVMGL